MKPRYDMVILIAALLISIPAGLHAQGAAGEAAKGESGDEPAKKHFKVGTVLYNDGNYEGALVEFRASYAAKKNIKVCTYVSLALQALSRYTEAEKELKKCLEECADKVTPEIRAEIDNVLVQLGTVIGSANVACSVEGAAVFFSGQPAGTTPLAAPVRLNVGHYMLEVKKEGYEDYSAEFDLPGEETVTMTVDLTVKPQPPEPVKPPPEAAPPEKGPEGAQKDSMAEAVLILKKDLIEKEKQKALKKNPYKRAGHGLFWSGFIITTLMGFLVTVAVNFTAKDYYDGDTESIEINAMLSSIAVSGYVIGGSMMLTGIVMWSLAPGYRKKIEKKYSSLSVAVGADARGATLGLSGRW